jgi:acetoin utilization protein AcuC
MACAWPGMGGWSAIISGPATRWRRPGFELTIELARAFGLFAEAGVPVQSPVAATDAELEMVHDPRYIAGVRLAGAPEPDPSVLDFGLGTEDNPVYPGMHDASALGAGATLAAARAVWAGAAQHGASIAGSRVRR